MDERRSDYPDIVKRLDHLDECLDRLNVTVRSVLYGDPSGDMARPGLMTRLDRLEQRSLSNRNMITIISTVCGGLVAELLHRLLK